MINYHLINKIKKTNLLGKFKEIAVVDAEWPFIALENF